MWSGFEWDATKAKSNLTKHRVSFEDATTIFDDEHSQTIYDPGHSDSEERFITMGVSSSGQILVVCHCDRADHIRIISARRAVPREQRNYRAKAD
jgi:uncharacterized DUF497 family protein